MANPGGAGVAIEIKRPLGGSAPVLEGAVNDLEALLPIALIRAHTKTDDVPNVTDEQLALYRQTAFEVCERYTGLLFTAIKVVTENVKSRSGHRNRGRATHKLRHPSVDGIVHLYGSYNGQNDRTMYIGVGEKEVAVPPVYPHIDLSSCCGGPCGGKSDDPFALKVMYRTGHDCKKPVPAGIILGVLKFIAWLITNPGDVIMTVRNRSSTGEMGIIGTNNGAWASGAIEHWRIYVDDAI